ncbi:hypothetical protein BRI6_0384 [plant metagenome]|uniref:PhoP regulatory network protein YrbL n=1 Tax=plant metagenome TaxID=1297885 RepID=A0A484S423_9ZZZZ
MDSTGHATSTDRPEALNLATLIGTGNQRECWQHPLDPSLCIKVSRAGQSADLLENALELHYLQHLNTRKLTSQHLPKIHQPVATSKGHGIVVELIRGRDGQAAQTLERMLHSGAISQLEALGLITEMLHWLHKNGVIWNDVNLCNVVVAHTCAGRPYLVIVDGLGGRRYDLRYRLRCKFKFLERWTARRKINQHFPKILAYLGLSDAPPAGSKAASAALPRGATVHH